MFEIMTRMFEITTRMFEITTRMFEIITRMFEIITRIFEIITRMFEIITKMFEIYNQNVRYIKICDILFLFPTNFSLFLKVLLIQFFEKNVRFSLSSVFLNFMRLYTKFTKISFIRNSGEYFAHGR